MSSRAVLNLLSSSPRFWGWVVMPLVPLVALGCPFDVDVGEEMVGGDPAFTIAVKHVDTGGSPCSDPADDSDPLLEETRTCSHDFGGVPVGAPASWRFEVMNPGPSEVEVGFRVGGNDAFRIEATDPFSSTDLWMLGADGSPGDQAAGLTEAVELEVVFAPTAEGPAEGWLEIVYVDAGSATQRVLRIELAGEGQPGLPLSFSPAVCNFGEVPIGTQATCMLTANNTGTTDINILGLEVGGDDDGAFSLVGSGSPGFPFTLAPGASLSIITGAEPQAAGVHTGTLNVNALTSGEERVSPVALRVVGVAGPVAVARVLSVNGALVGSDAPEINPLDDVVLTAEDSVAPAGGSVVEASWELVSVPAGSTVTLTQPNDMTTGFAFSDFSGIDLLGVYVVELTVVDDLGVASTNSAQLSFQATSSVGLLVELRWNTPGYDVDVHLRKAGSEWCSEGDCYYAGCRQPTQTTDFDGIEGFSAGDPTLDIDDISGWGPENISIEAPLDGTYRVGVNSTSATAFGEFDATIRVYVYGAVVAELSQTFTEPKQFWEAADIAWDDDGATVTSVGGVEDNWSCPDS